MERPIPSNVGARSRQTEASSREQIKKGPELPTLTAPTGGGAIRGIGESFAHNAVTGTVSVTIPVEAPAGRNGFGPSLSLSYDSGAGASAFGWGWQMSVGSVARKLDKRLPRYIDEVDSDVFVYDGEELVRLLRPRAPGGERLPERAEHGGRSFHIRYYRPRVDTAFSLIQRWTDEVSNVSHWRVVSRDNVTTIFGDAPAACVHAPDRPDRIFEWLPTLSYDDRGDAISFVYGSDTDARDVGYGRARDGAAARYLERVRWANERPYHAGAEIPAERAWHFELVLDYGGHPDKHPRIVPDRAWPMRADPFSTYRAGFEIRSRRLCRRILTFHRFPELGSEPVLTRSLDLRYAENPDGSRLIAATRRGYRHDADAPDGVVVASFPAVEFEYQPFVLGHEPQIIRDDGSSGVPGGIDGARSRLVDLDSEGLPGVLTEAAGTWFYRRNISNGAEAKFEPPRMATRLPASARLSGGRQVLQDISGNGHLCLVQYGRPMAGFHEREEHEDWSRFVPFHDMPDIDFQDANLQFIDLDGDGRADLLFTGDDMFIWYRSRAKEGFEPGLRVAKPGLGDGELDRTDAGPSLIFADGTQSLYLADMSGDGLVDIVRISNGGVVYWPNLGHGHFGQRVAMACGPVFDKPDGFDQSRVRLADVDGSGTTDLIYLGAQGAIVYRNCAGNSWSEGQPVLGFPRHCPPDSVMVADLLGRGTSCLVWSSPLPDAASAPLYFVDLTRGTKPHLLIAFRNNMGAETQFSYAASTRFYVRDREAGRPWATRLPFPVHVLERSKTFDRIAGNSVERCFNYRHGCYDPVEREFRGFGMVEERDIEQIGSLGAPVADANPYHAPPVLTRTWYHTGADLFDPVIAAAYARDMWSGDEDEHVAPRDVINPGEYEDIRESWRALRGAVLRQEVFALDGTPAQGRPYSVSQSSYQVRRIQPSGPARRAILVSHPRESIEWHYERALSGGHYDPRVSHQWVLDVDDYGTELSSVAIAYGRQGRDPALTDIEAAEQARSHVLWSETKVTGSLVEAAAYRAPLPFETRSYEVGGLQWSQKRLTFDDILASLARATRHEVPSHDVMAVTAPANSPWRRLLSRNIVIFRSDDLSRDLPPGQLQSRTLPARHLALAMTDGIVSEAFGSRVDDKMLREEAGYRRRDDGWWTTSSEVFYSQNPQDDPVAELDIAQAHFFLPQRLRDPFGNDSVVRYDRYQLLVVETQDAMGNRVTAGERGADGERLPGGLDYRVLQPHLVTDPNRNRTAVIFDAHGLVVATAVMGKTGEQVGDVPVIPEVDATEQTLVAAFADPQAAGDKLIGGATTRTLYDLFAYGRGGATNPPAVLVYAREMHVADETSGQPVRIIAALSYSDGFGRDIQHKKEAEPGDDGKPRWITSGWTAFDSKGRPVRRYEPFFSERHGFEHNRREGVSSILIYDPPGRVIGTLHPDKTWEKTVFDVWRQQLWDGNDTVLLNPRRDPDIGAGVAGLSTADTEPGWYAARIDGRLGAEPQTAARRASVHAATPGITQVDSLGRNFLATAWNRTERDGVVVDEHPRVRTLHDAVGNEIAVIDAQGRTVLRNVCDLTGKVLFTDSMEGGWRRSLADLTGKPLVNWNARGHRLRTSYDALRRPSETLLADGTKPEKVVSRTVYGEAATDAEARNLRGSVVRTEDCAGIVDTESYDFKGNVLAAVRRLAQDIAVDPDWSGSVALEPTAFRSATIYDALNRPVLQIAPHPEGGPGNMVGIVYDRAGQPQRISLWERILATDSRRIAQTRACQQIVTGIDYDAKGQRLAIDYGNGTRTDYAYDPATFRVTRCTTLRGSDRLQDLSYVYDPIGNVISIRDDAQQPIFFRNQVVDASASYVYDATYRLVEARGREHLGQNGAHAPEAFDQARTGLAHPGDGGAMARYVERYDYDAAGNLIRVRHHGDARSRRSWTRHYHYDEPSAIEPNHVSNRLSRTRVGDGEAPLYRYDAGGNMLAMSHLAEMTWDFLDRLRCVTRRADGEIASGERVVFVSSASGERLRKVTLRDGRLVAERLYLGAFERYREYAHDGETVLLERETLHVSDDARRVLMVETRTVGEDQAPARLARFQLGNHLGSAVLELDGEAAVISYEEYYPFGASSYQAFRSKLETPKRYRFTGKERDEETGLACHGARYYAPWLGRWTSPDPAGLVDGPNLYAYASSNPVVFVDPEGTQSADPPPGGRNPVLNREVGVSEGEGGLKTLLGEKQELVEGSRVIKSGKGGSVIDLRTKLRSFESKVLDIGKKSYRTVSGALKESHVARVVRRAVRQAAKHEAALKEAGHELKETVVLTVKGEKNAEEVAKVLATARRTAKGMKEGIKVGVISNRASQRGLVELGLMRGIAGVGLEVGFGALAYGELKQDIKEKEYGRAVASGAGVAASATALVARGAAVFTGVSASAVPLTASVGGMSAAEGIAAAPHVVAAFAVGAAIGVGIQEGSAALSKKYLGREISPGQMIGDNLTATDTLISKAWTDPAKPAYTQTIGWKIAGWLTPTSN